MGRPESRLASATNRPMNPVEPTIMVRPASETLEDEPHMFLLLSFYFNAPLAFQEIKHNRTQARTKRRTKMGIYIERREVRGQLR